MTDAAVPLVICAPEPRTLDLIFRPGKLLRLRQNYRLVETTADGVAELPDETLGKARYILGQPPLTKATLEKLTDLRAVLNVESNLLDNMPYDDVFRRGIHVLTTGSAFAQSVAEIGLGFAIDLARGISAADADFQAGREAWGGDGNGSARLLGGSEIGIVGFGDLGRALNRLLTGFRATVRVCDPWLPPSILRDHGVLPASLDDVLSHSDTVFVVASVTAENAGFIGAADFTRMRRGAAFILLSRAGVVNFDALLDAVAEARITAATDVWPEEPMPADHRARGLPGLLRSAHRAGALDQAFKAMGDMVLEDMDLMDRGLPPVRLKRAERETARRMRSRPVERN